MDCSETFNAVLNDLVSFINSMLPNCFRQSNINSFKYSDSKLASMILCNLACGMICQDPKRQNQTELFMTKIDIQN